MFVGKTSLDSHHNEILIMFSSYTDWNERPVYCCGPGCRWHIDEQLPGTFGMSPCWQLRCKQCTALAPGRKTQEHEHMSTGTQIGDQEEDGDAMEWQFADNCQLPHTRAEVEAVLLCVAKKKDDETEV